MRIIASPRKKIGSHAPVTRIFLQGREVARLSCEVFWSPVRSLAKSRACHTDLNFELRGFRVFREVARLSVGGFFDKKFFGNKGLFSIVLGNRRGGFRLFN
ncbi:MAG: hypothetical protein EBZ36_18090 [Acidobacteria bacterium]|nr:hypothetical protein [Acidobacteriota bacterium]